MVRFSPASIFLFACLGFVGGILASQGTHAFEWQILSIFIGGIFLLTFGYRNLKALGIGLCILAFGLGFVRGEEAFRERHAEERLFSVQNAIEEEQEIVGRVAEDPERTGRNTRIVFQPEFAEEGRILLFASPFSAIAYGDTIRVVGVLESPPEFEDFSYREYLRDRSIYSVAYHPDITIVPSAGSLDLRQSAMGHMLRMKDRFREYASLHIPSPSREIFAAVILGDKHMLAPETQEFLNRAGIRHITAISGMHVAIFTKLAMGFFLLIGLWRKQAFYLALACVLFFVVFTGLQPSAIRAGIMGSIFLLGEYLGRPGVSLRILIYAALLMLAIDPFLVREIGFQLSFLAVFGIITLLPVCKYYLERFSSKHVRFVGELLGMTVAAQLFTLPVLIANFGYVSLISPLANMLVVPLLPILLAAGLVFLIGSSLWGGIGFFLSLPVVALLWYVVSVAQALSAIPFIAPETSAPLHMLVFLLYVPLAYLVWKIKQRSEFLAYS